MPPRRKPENRGLPKRWQHTHGAYYYRVPPGSEALWGGKKRFLLGHTLSDAYTEYAARVQKPETVRTVGQLLERYALEVVPTKAPKTQTENARHIKMLRKVFDKVPLEQVDAQWVYKYVDLRRNVKTGGKAVTASHREIEVLSHAYTRAVKWGLLKRHPFKGEVELDGEQSRTRYVEDWEITEALSLKAKPKSGAAICKAYLRLKLCTGMSKGDLLRLEPARQFREDGIHNQRHKTLKSTGKRTIYEWTPERREAVAQALAERPVDLAPWLFCTRRGGSYVNEAKGTTKAFDKLWARFMVRVKNETKVTEHFTDHDIRAKVGSDAESLDQASRLLAHANPATTAKIYRRKPDRV